MPSDAFLLIDGITGESIAMQNTIELDGYSFAGSNPADVTGKGLSAGKVSMSEFNFSCPTDTSSYQILKDMYMGTHIATATLSVRKSGGGAQPFVYLTVTMTNCYITSWSFGGGANGIPSQSCTLAYEQVKFEYFTQDTTSGSVTQAGSATYNIAKTTQS
ncbi:MAG: type VI secretion system tube protein Hcp [Candidatus Sulfotelmatobacter sp.]